MTADCIADVEVALDPFQMNVQLQSTHDCPVHGQNVVDGGVTTVTLQQSGLTRLVVNEGDDLPWQQGMHIHHCQEVSCNLQEVDVSPSGAEGLQDCPRDSSMAVEGGTINRDHIAPAIGVVQAAGCRPLCWDPQGGRTELDVTLLKAGLSKRTFLGEAVWSSCTSALRAVRRAWVRST